MKRKLILPFLLTVGIVITLMAGFFPTQSVFAQNCGQNQNQTACPEPKEVKETKTPIHSTRTETPTPTYTPEWTATPEYTKTPNSTEIAAFHTQYPLENQVDTNPPPDPNSSNDQPSLSDGGISPAGILIGMLIGILIGLLVGILIGMLLPAVNKGLRAANPFIKGENAAFHKDVASPFHKGEGSSQGIIGPLDSQGIIGPLDSQGIIGPLDSQGIIGPLDSQGVIGEEGSQGIIGEDNPFHKI